MAGGWLVRLWASRLELKDPVAQWVASLFFKTFCWEGFQFLNSTNQEEGCPFFPWPLGIEDVAGIVRLHFAGQACMLLLHLLWRIGGHDNIHILFGQSCG